MTNSQSKLGSGVVGDIAPLGADAPSWPSDLAREAVWGVGPEQVCMHTYWLFEIHPSVKSHCIYLADRQHSKAVASATM